MLRALARHWAWLALGLTVLFVVVVRVRLREMPLERDEGEYAYAGQLLLQGVPPYTDAYNMKLPGTYAAYALILAVFGQTISGIHLGLLLVNVASIFLVFVLGRRLLGDPGGVVAAVAFALMSLNPRILGLAGHATHFVVLPALGGLLVLARVLAPEQGRSARHPALGALFVAGLLFGIAFVMKQHGLFFGVCGFAFLLRSWILSSRRELGFLILSLVPYALGCMLPYLVTCLILWRVGTLGRFTFWTITYARKYAAMIPLADAADNLRETLRVVIPSQILLWCVAWAGLMALWGNTRLTRHRFFLVALTICSLLGSSVGFYFREHYLILLLPALALLAGALVARALEYLQSGAVFELIAGFPLPGRFVAWPMLGLCTVALGGALISNADFWFGLAPERALRQLYGTSLFSQAIDIGQYIREHSTAGARIAVVGSEPEIYFYARRRSATGYIYTYPLMENHPYAAKLQEAMAAEITAQKPDYVVFVDDFSSWMPRPNSPHLIFEWWQGYWSNCLDLATSVNVEDRKSLPFGADGGGDTNRYLVLRRRGLR